jgi:hypothetical protein
MSTSDTNAAAAAATAIADQHFAALLTSFGSERDGDMKMVHILTCFI